MGKYCLSEFADEGFLSTPLVTDTDTKFDPPPKLKILAEKKFKSFLLKSSWEIHQIRNSEQKTKRFRSKAAILEKEQKHYTPVIHYGGITTMTEP